MFCWQGATPSSVHVPVTLFSTRKANACLCEYASCLQRIFLNCRALLPCKRLYAEACKHKTQPTQPDNSKELGKKHREWSTYYERDRDRDIVSGQQKSIQHNNTLHIECAHRALFIQAPDSGLTQVLTSTLMLISEL